MIGLSDPASPSVMITPCPMASSVRSPAGEGCRPHSLGRFLGRPPQRLGLAVPLGDVPENRPPPPGARPRCRAPSRNFTSIQTQCPALCRKRWVFVASSISPAPKRIELAAKACLPSSGWTKSARIRPDELLRVIAKDIVAARGDVEAGAPTCSRPDDHVALWSRRGGGTAPRWPRGRPRLRFWSVMSRTLAVKS